LAPDEYAALTMVLLRLLAFKPNAAQNQQAISPTAEKKTLTTTTPSQAHAAQPAPVVNDAPITAAPIEVKTLAVREASEPSQRAAPRAVVLSEEGNFWTETVRSLIAAESINALVRELALQSQLMGRDTGQWQLRIESESLNQGTARERLQTALQTLGHEVKLVVEIGKVTDSPAMRNAAALLEKQKAAEELIQSDPLVQNMIQEFGAKIVPGSIKLISSH
jgi:DNA polymerase-3 subunit gamma/tau